MKIQPITFSYLKQKQPVLRDLSMKLVEDKINVIIGKNGAGKSTFLDILTGVHQLKEFKPPIAPKDIVYQLQHIYLPPALKGKDIVRLILKTDLNESFKTCIERFIRSLEEQEKEMVDRLWKTKIGDMSDGERRWLIIRAICELDRKLYIFDEPTTGIDPSSRMIIMSTLEKLAKRKGVYCMMTTHILHELNFLDCNINFLHNGKIAYHGDYDTFLRLNNTDNPDVAFQQFLNEVS